MCDLSLKRSGNWDALTRDHTVLPATHTFIHIWNEPSCLYFPAAEHHRTLAGSNFLNRDGIPTSGRPSQCRVLTGFVTVLMWPLPLPLHRRTHRRWPARYNSAPSPGQKTSFYLQYLSVHTHQFWMNWRRVSPMHYVGYTLREIPNIEPCSDYLLHG